MKLLKLALICAVLSVLAAYTSAQAQTAQATWQDNSGNACTPTQCDQEDRFILDFAVDSGPLQVAGVVGPNITTFDHDISAIPAGTVLTYRVCAENSAGKTCSAGVKYTVPTPVQQMVMPIPPGAVAIQFIFP